LSSGLPPPPCLLAPCSSDAETLTPIRDFPLEDFWELSCLGCARAFFPSPKTINFSARLESLGLRLLHPPTITASSPIRVQISFLAKLDPRVVIFTFYSFLPFSHVDPPHPWQGPIFAALDPLKIVPSIFVPSSALVVRFFWNLPPSIQKDLRDQKMFFEWIRPFFTPLDSVPHWIKPDPLF